MRETFVRLVTTFPKSPHTLKSELRATFYARMKFGEEMKQIGVLSEFFGDFKFQNFQIQPRLYEISLLGTVFF